jgi:hypothetical protein
MYFTCIAKIGNLETTGTSHSLYSTNNALCPREVAWIFAYGAWCFIAVFVAPEAVFLRGHAVEVGIYNKSDF